jgi:hypothetical protein
MPGGNTRTAAISKMRPAARRCYHHKWDETQDYRPHPRHRIASCRPRCRSAARLSSSGRRPDPVRSAGSFPRSVGPCCRPSGRSSQSRTGPRHFRFSASVRARGPRGLARSRRSFLPAACSRLRQSYVAHPRQLGARARPRCICDVGCGGRAVSLSQRHIVLARLAQMTHAASFLTAGICPHGSAPPAHRLQQLPAKYRESTPRRTAPRLSQGCFRQTAPA